MKEIYKLEIKQLLRKYQLTHEAKVITENLFVSSGKLNKSKLIKAGIKENKIDEIIFKLRNALADYKKD